MGSIISKQRPRPFFKIRRRGNNPGSAVEYVYVETIKDANFSWLEGRRVSADDFYPVERHVEDTDRVAILMHDLHKYILRGNTRIPLTSEMKRCLYIGSGHYIWLLEMADDHKKIQFEGFDVTPAEGDLKGPLPLNANFVHGNIFNGGLPYPDEYFDYINVRSFLTWLPSEKITFVIKECCRATKRGGWIEILESDIFVKNPTPYYEDNLGKIWKDLCKYQCYDPNNIINLNKYLERGFSDVRTSKLSIPIGKYGGKVGQLYAEIFIGATTAIAAVMMEKLNMTNDEIQSYLQKCVEGLNSNQSYTNSYLVCAKKV